MIKQLAFILLLLTPLALLPTSKPAFNLAEERKTNGAPRPPAQPGFTTDSIAIRPVPSALPPAPPAPTSSELEFKEHQENNEEFKEKETNEMIDARAIALRLTKDCSSRPRCAKQNSPLIPLAILMEKAYKKDDADDYCLNQLFSDMDRLKLKETSLNELIRATIAGNIEMVQLLLHQIAGINRQDEPFGLSAALNLHHIRVMALTDIIHVLRILLDWSLIPKSSAKCQGVAAALLRNFGLPVKPQYENYPLIAKELIRKALDLIANEEPQTLAIQYSGAMKLKKLLSRAMSRGSNELVQIFAEELGKNPIHKDWPHHLSFQLPKITNGAKSVFEQAVFDTINGEKLGILLSVDAHPELATFQLAMGMLSHVEKNPRLLSRLKKYILRYQKAVEHISTHLLPDLAPCVAEYAWHCMPAETAKYILNLRPTEAHSVEEDNSLLGQYLTSMMGDDEESLLGQHMTALMTRRRQIRD